MIFIPPPPNFPPVPVTPYPPLNPCQLDADYGFADYVTQDQATGLATYLNALAPIYGPSVLPGTEWDANPPDAPGIYGMSYAAINWQIKIGPDGLTYYSAWYRFSIDFGNGPVMVGGINAGLLLQDFTRWPTGMVEGMLIQDLRSLPSAPLAVSPGMSISQAMALKSKTGPL